MILGFEKDGELISPEAQVQNSTIVPPVMIAEGAKVVDSVVGPHVSIGQGAHVERSVISNSIIREQSTLQAVVLNNSMIGMHARLKGVHRDVSLGDYSSME